MSEEVTQKEYWDQIRSIVKSAEEEYRGYGNGEDPNDWFSEWLPQTIDGHQWIIYTWYNTQVLTHSDNRDAYFEEYGSLEADGFSDAMAKMAYAAMYRDVSDHMDIDVLEEIRDEDED